ncbi:ABC transporter [Hymenopellis radicata]|nr:ABC transporter [Hymenopellis radicata]
MAESIPLQVICEDGAAEFHASASHSRSHFKERLSRRTTVSLDYFDPVGTQNLAERLRRVSRSHLADSQTTLSDQPRDPDAFDLEKVMREMISQSNQAQIKYRQLGVSFEGLRVVGLGSASSYQETLGTLLNPSYLGERLRNARNPSLRNIISGFEGVVRPGDMLLVLGSPGSGCTTLLKALTNQRSEYYSVEGEVNYDSLTPDTLAKHFRGDVQYCPEDDVHFPTLTVDQTLKFAAKTRAPHKRPLAWSSKEDFIDVTTDILMTVFGLRHAKHTFVGDSSIRGVSGGEKKRVSIAEALATRSRIAAWDNSTRGLDSSTALEFGRALRIATDMTHMATIVSIYQASESLYQLFDKVCVVYEGRMAYFGPADQARQYFIDMGYVPANRQTTPDFLVAIADAHSRIPNPDVATRPRTASEFADYFLKSPIGQQNRDDIELYKSVYVGSTVVEQEYRTSASEEHARHSRLSSAYVISIPMQVRAVMTRRVQILKGNRSATIAQLLSFIVNGIIVGTVFLRLKSDTSSFFSRGGVLYFALLFGSLSSMAEIPALFSQRTIVARHQKAAMYHPMIESIALTLVDIPISTLTMLVFGIMMYFLVGLQSTAKQFSVFLLYLNTTALLMKAIYRAVAAATTAEASAMAVAGLTTLALNIYTGYTIPKLTMVSALKWIAAINPLRYAFEGVMANELHGFQAHCISFVPSGPGYEGVSPLNQVCAVVGSTAGQIYVEGDVYLKLAFDYSYDNLWKNFGIIVGFLGAFWVAQFLFSEYNTSLASDNSTVMYRRGGQHAVRGPEKHDEEFGFSSTTAQAKPIDHGTAPIARSNDLFSWFGLNYTVSLPSGQRVLLDNVMGYVAPGKLTALMGESGAGKTTLLNVLAQRVAMGVIRGDRLVNGQRLPNDFQSQTGYCQQMDTHTPTDTVREALLISAKLRQPVSVPLAEKEAYVDQCLKMCGLEDYADAIVGSLGVEHRKRTTIAVELAAKPKLLLFLDEPTSGLDSQSAWAIVRFLQDLARSGQAILCTIHQPSAELFQAFDRLLLLQRGGKMVYLERNGARRCHYTENPAEFMLDVIGAGATAQSEHDWHQLWNDSPERADLQKTIEGIHATGKSGGAVLTETSGEFATPWMNQFRVLYTRENIARWRNPTYLTAKLMMNIATGLFVGFTFYQSDNSRQGTTNKIFAIFLCLVGSVTLVNQLSVETINMRHIYETRERPSRMYHWSSFLAAHFLSELFWNVLGSLILVLCWYWTVGFPSSRAPYTFLCLALMYPTFYTSIGIAVAVSSPNAQVANILSSFVFVFILVFNGVMQPFRLLGWWKWMYHVTPFTYLVEGLAANVIGGGLTMSCSEREFVSLDPPSGQTCGAFLQHYMEMADTRSCHFCPFLDADVYLEQALNMSYSHRWRDVGLLWIYIVVNILAMFFLMYILRIRRSSN